ncbi:chaperonin 10-like protein [Pyronema domesticum]|uniref:alcohol dehydrogenase (NADP(+)) n=1 Tax=Pyronema omphalodes (strain CBS 100304) TaxID=1076935 RepID=U4KW95_PYROM|nr:chaperonin 10-like protein [Pyronema domesticum]CCX05361.1 Similar to NADP-dependent alcohol dehydrogenase 6; acc. no. Q04894 [Pyronema omphalodes CBS 100304]
MSAPTEYKFSGWMGLDNESYKGQLVEGEYEVKPFEENDVDIKVSHCGICGSDLHTLRSGWGQTAYPCVVGHEIVGTAVKVGSSVKGIKVGDRVGVGAQSSSCLQADCEECAAGDESYCPRIVGTYGSKHKSGHKSFGGYADYARVPSHFVVQLSDISLSSEVLAPMMCGGVTVYSPLVRNGCGPGKRVGIVGLGGLGHFGVLFARALGADKVVAISRKASKRADALAMGADLYISTDEDPDWATTHAKSLDLIVSTVSGPNMPFAGYLQLLRTHGVFIQVGAPEDKLPAISAFSLIGRGLKVGGSLIGSPKEIRDMVELADKKGVKSWVNLWPMTKVNEALIKFEEGVPRYRFVLVNEKHAEMPDARL